MRKASVADFSKALPTKIRKSVYFRTSESMKEVEDETIQTVITSPPYWNLKDYGHPQQIGFNESYETYHERIEKVWFECRRVLKKDGTMWIVVDRILRDQEITHIPYDIAQRCRKLGFLLQDIIIWNKPTAIAGMSPKNLVSKYEHILFLSKTKSFKLRAIAEDKKASPDWARDLSRLTDIWRFPVKAGSIKKTPLHEAPYPEELIRRILLLSTDETDTVLDPFLGSGTTMKVALHLNRGCVGYEINPDFAKMMTMISSDLAP